MTVIEQVVEKNWCVGCGMCAAVCPNERLEIRWNDRGEYNPKVIQGSTDCGANCSLCYEICPAHGQTKNETEIGQELYAEIPEIQHTPQAGYWLNSYVGYSNEHRLDSASGGIATWLLERLLVSGEVDAIAAVGRTDCPDKLFEFKICETIKQIRACSRSAYYPVEVSRVIRYFLDNDGRYAIIGLPCVCKAIRLAQDKFPVLRKRIKYVLGLTCGHTCSKFFAEYICALGGGNPHKLNEFIFRTKDLSQPASNLGMTFRAGQGADEVAKQVLWRDGVGEAFTNSYFQLPGCFYCDDIFAECADAVFMDAWLPEYARQPEGHTIALIRAVQIRNLLVDGESQGTLSLCDLTLKATISSQQGVVERKRFRVVNFDDEPIKRNELLRKPRVFQFLLGTLYRSCGKVTPEKWPMADKNLLEFNQLIRPILWKILIVQKLRKITSLPLRAVRKIYKLSGG